MKNRVKELRENKGWTQEEFAKRLSVSRQTVISIEKGVYNPSLELAFHISAVFRESIHDIFISFMDYRESVLMDDLLEDKIDRDGFLAGLDELNKRKRGK